MYSKPGSGGGATYCACAGPAAIAAAHATTMAGAAPLRARRSNCCMSQSPP